MIPIIIFGIIIIITATIDMIITFNSPGPRSHLDGIALEAPLAHVRWGSAAPLPSMPFGPEQDV